jgi:uncharacterized protein (TIGR02145 family)
MKNLKGNLIYPLFLMGLVLIFSYGCKKSSSNNDLSPAPGGVTVTDVEGNVYPVVTIGTQTWMAANLKTTKYRNGNPIPLVADSVQWSVLTTSGYCDVNNNAAMVSVFGRFYNWYAVTDSNNIAPLGWHVPTEADWTTLSTFLGTGPGGKLKGTGTKYWYNPNAGATNSTGFNGLPGGDRSNTGTFHYMGTYGCFWCTTPYSDTEGWEYILSTNSTSLLKMNFSKGLGLSVRCVKD